MEQCLFAEEAELAEAGRRMDAVEQLAAYYEMPLLDALETEYAEKIAQRGWLVCGPASIVLANLISEDTGIPIAPFNERLDRECLQLEMYIYNARNQPGLAPRMDHTNLLYNSGNGFSMTLDLTYQLIWRGFPKQPGALLTDRHYGYLTNSHMKIYNLRPVNEVGIHAGWRSVWGDDTDAWAGDAVDMLAIMQSPHVFDDAVWTTSKKAYDVSAFWGSRLRRVYQNIRQQVPLGSLPQQLK